MNRAKLAYLARPYIHRELPGWGKILKFLKIEGVDNTNPQWRDAPVVSDRGKYHGYRVQLNLSDDSDRLTYFLGRYYDLDIQLLLDVVLQPGDTCIDIGANVGNMTLHAAYRVGPKGRVISFEPNPQCYQRICQVIAENHLAHVSVHNIALGEEPGRVTLKVLGGGTIMASLAIDSRVDTWVREEIEVEVVRGDDLIGKNLGEHVLLKADVEGYELYALRGFGRMIEHHRPMILIEVEPRYLKRAGADEYQLFNFVQSRGYKAYAVDLHLRFMRKPHLRLIPVDKAADLKSLSGDIDLFWLPEEETRFDPAKYF